MTPAASFKSSLLLLLLLFLAAVVEAVDTNGPFTCRDGVVRPNVTTCDGVWQCPGGEDENHCESCVAGAIYCGGECFGRHAVCNGIRNCPNGEDEKDCGAPQASPSTPPSSSRPSSSSSASSPRCGKDTFACGGGHCIARKFVCDGVADCASGADEEGCSQCRGEAFRCLSGWCEHKARCDGTAQCPGGEDERGCPKSGGGDPVLTCADGTTRLSSTRCDGWLACPGGDDERNCSAAECRDGAFFCGGVCKPASRRCDGVRQCPDGEDERGCSTATPPTPPRACGKAPRGPDPLVANGTQAEVGAFPWHAALYVRRNDGEMHYFCGASLVTETALITAAHCFALQGGSLQPSNFSVALGKVYSSWSAEIYGVHKSTVARYTLHPDYDGVIAQHSSDIAVVHMEQPAPLGNNNISPVCLAGGQLGILRPRDYVTVVGWGNGQTPLAELAYVRMPYLTRRQCLQKLRRYSHQQVNSVTFDKFCVERETGVPAPGALLQGDSGGGAVVQRDGRWHLVGIVSLGLADGRIGAFTNVTLDEILAWAVDTF